MPSKHTSSVEHSNDVYVKREKWGNHYHVAARQQGRFVHTSKWKGSHSTEKVLDSLTEKTIQAERSRYTYLVHAENPDDQTRSLAVFATHRVFKGAKRGRKKAKLHTKPIYEAAREKYKTCRFKPDTFQMFRIYDGDMIL